MNNQFERGPVDPYPLRPSSFVEVPGALELKESLKLTEDEKKALLNFEAELFAELKEVKEIKVNSHEIYPAALASGKGKAMMEIFYKQGNDLKKWVKQEAELAGLNLEDKEILGDVYKTVFDDLFEEKVAKSKEEVEFVNFAKLIKEKTGKNIRVVKTFEFDETNTTPEEITKIFAEFDMKSIPLKWRERIHWYTDEWAKETTRTDFFANGGQVSEMENQSRICRLTDPEKNIERMTKLREMKRKVKSFAKEFTDQEGDLDKAKVIVSEIYRKYINTQIASDALLWVGSGEEGKDVFALNTAAMERYDRFLNGAGIDFDEHRNRALLTEKIDDIVSEIEQTRTVEPEKITDVTSDDEVRVANWVIAEYGFPKWKAVKRKSSLGSIGILVSESKINIPKISKKNLVVFLATIAHEIEGHVLSHENWDNVELPLKIMRYYSAGGRDNVLAEGAGKKVEKETRRMIDGYEDRPEINYYLAMKLRLEGGTFKDCLKLFYDTRVKKQELNADEGKYKKAFDYAYSSAMRLFREHTDLDDKSGRLTTTDQLKYLEQETVVRELEEKGLDAILYVNGPDLYSVMDLIRLGAFDLEKIQKPKMVVANKIWPMLRDGLARGLSVKDILDEAGVAK